MTPAREQIELAAKEAELYEDGRFFVVAHDEFERFAALVAAAEREACAKVCDAVYEREGAYGSNQAQICADKIRARGQR